MQNLTHSGAPGGHRLDLTLSASRRDFLSVPIHCLTLDETIAAAERAIKEGRVFRHVCINVAKFVAMRSDPELDGDVRSSDIINVDGMGIVWAARLVGVPIPERVAGVDVMDAMIERCATAGYRPYFLGAKQDVLNVAIAKVKAKFPGIEIAGARNGYFTAAEESEVVAAIRSSKADCLFIGMPTPRKERFLARHGHGLGVSFIMGVGGALDVLAGHVRRAPRLVQNLGLEWLFRMAQEPRRLAPRYFVSNTVFAGIMAKALMRRVMANA